MIMGKNAEKKSKHQGGPPPPPPPEINVNRSVATLNPATQTSFGGKYPCHHQQAVVLKKGIDINRYTLKIERDKKDPEKYIVEFTYDAYVDGSITLYFFEIGGEDYNMSPTTKELIEPMTVDVKKGLGQKFIQKEGNGVCLPLHKVGITEVYHLAIKAHSHRHKTEDGSTNRGTTVSQSTLAVFHMEKGECQVRVTNQIIWVNGEKYVLHDFTGFRDSMLFDGNNPGKCCLLCLSRDCHGEERKIGNLLVSNKEIGWGGKETTVFMGIYERRKVAVKRILKTHNDVAEKEIKTLIASDWHPNIVRYYGVERDRDFVYIALECCVCSLHDLLTVEVFKDIKLWKSNNHPSPDLLRLMRDTVKGLAHLHKLGIIHRDVKPGNVLIQKYTDAISAKVSDMGISKRLLANESSLPKSTTCIGSSGWQAPERLRNEEGQTRAVDLFSIGCLLFFCITRGEHPFGEHMHVRDTNILNDQKELSLVKEIPEAYDLIVNLLHPIPTLRPTAAEACNHPLFWDPKTRLDFLRDASDRVEIEVRGSNLRKSLENIGDYRKWNKKLNKQLLRDIRKHRYYRYNKVYDILRAIRNIYNHHGTLSATSQRVVGAVPTGLDGYFSSRFPKLVMEVYNLLKGCSVEGEPLHEHYKPYQFKV